MPIQKRIEWIDYAKVIGIWLVIFGHIINSGRPMEKELWILIYSFHMPFFFFVSGLLFSTKDMTFRPFLKSKIKSLIVPYVLLNVLCLTLSIPLYVFSNVFPTADIHSFTDDLLNLMDGKLGSAFAPPSWFLLTLFILMAFSFFVIKLNIWWQALVVLFAIALSYIAVIFKFPYNLDTIPTSYVFFFMGYLLKQHFKDLSNNVWGILASFLIIFTIFVILSLYNGKVSINDIIGKTYGLFWVTASFGILALYLFANVLSRLLQSAHAQWYRWLQLVSGGTIFILCFHETCIAYSIDYFLVNHSFHIPLVMREIMLSIAIVLICVPIIWVIRRYMPVMLGNRK